MANWVWNLFFGNGQKAGECEGDCKEDIERVAKECLKMDVYADLKRKEVDIPERKGWWNSN